MLHRGCRQGDGFVLNLIAIVRVVLKHGPEVAHVQGAKELLHGQLLLLQLYKEFLGMTSGLSARASAHMLLDLFPFFAINL